MSKNNIFFILLFISIIMSTFSYALTLGYNNPLTTKIVIGQIITSGGNSSFNKTYTDTLYYPLFTNPLNFFNITTIANSNIATKNLTVNSYLFLNKISGICDLSVNGTICSNATGTYIIG